MKDYKACVIVGRFQPPHVGHLNLINQGLEIAEKAIVIVGSYRTTPNIKNPFTFEERVAMMQSALSKEQSGRVHFVPVRDHHYSDNFWLTEAQEKTRQHFSYGDSVALLGNYRDSSSYYLKMFPQWDFVPAKNPTSINATTIRQTIFNANTGYADIKDQVPEGVHSWLVENFWGTEKHHRLIREQQHIEQYKLLWSNAPFPVIFITVDTVVVQGGHVLLVKRKSEPGKGLLALPGGFVKPTERLQDAAIRELKEETGIRVDAAILRSSVVKDQVFDYPSRSMRGRTITHAYYIKLRDGELPEVRGNDDAEKAFWLPMMDLSLNESNFFEDHFSIIQSFITQS